MSSIDVTKFFDSKGDSLLHCAVRNDNYEAVKFLVEHVKFRISNQKDEEPLRSEITKSSKNLAEVHFNERVLNLTTWINLLTKSKEGFTALHIASFNGNLRMIRYLIENKANPLCLNPQSNNCLHTAA